MNKNTKIVLGVVAVGAVAYYLYTKNKTATTVKNYSGAVGDRLGFASNNNIQAIDGNMYNNNLRYGMTGQKTFFTNQSEKLNY